MRNTRTAALALALLGLPVIAHAQPSNLVPSPGPQHASAPESRGERTAPSTYQYDNGVVSNSWQIGVGEAFWLHRFTAADGADSITSVSIAWGTLPDGTPARIHILQDPNSDGNPVDRVLLATINVNVQSPATGEFVAYTLPTPVPVSRDFYVGVSVPTTTNQFPIRSDTNTSISPGRAYFAAHPVQVDPAAIPLQAWPATLGYFALRADGVKTGFTYQGRLTDSSGPYTGTGDVRANIYDAATGGSAVANTYTATGVSFDHGLFSIRIPALASIFNTSDERWLEVAVRKPSGSGPYTALSPRQRITQAPTALFADAAGTASSVPWAGITGVPANISLSPWESAPGGIAYNGGRVGIGTTPVLTLDLVQGAVVGNSTVIADLFDPANRGLKVSFGYQAAGTGNFAGMRTVVEPGTNGCGNSGDLRFDTWECNTAGSREVMRIAGNGFVGIGTASPSSRLEVATAGVGGGWQMRFTNFSVPNFRGGMSLTDTGFFEVTNTSNLVNPNFARLASNGAWTAVSDARLKTDVTNADGLLDTALKLTPVKFRWKEDGANGLGLIAQDARAVLPTLVTGDESREMLTLDYDQLSVVTLGAIKELKADNDAKQRRIDELEARIAAIEAAMKNQSPVR